MRFRRRTNTTLLLCLALAAPAYGQPVQTEDVEEGEVEEGEEAPPIEEQAPSKDDAPAEEQPPADDVPASEDQGGGEEGDDVWGEMSDEELMGEGEDPSRPPAAGKGVIWGVVRDTKLNAPAIEATVSVVGKNIEVLTDFDGRFRLELPPGQYTVRVFYDMHKHNL